MKRSRVRLGDVGLEAGYSAADSSSQRRFGSTIQHEKSNLASTDPDRWALHSRRSMFPYDAPVPGSTSGQGYRHKALIHTHEPPRSRSPQTVPVVNVRTWRMSGRHQLPYRCPIERYGRYAIHLRRSCCKLDATTNNPQQGGCRMTSRHTSRAPRSPLCIAGARSQHARNDGDSHGWRVSCAMSEQSWGRE